MDSKVTLFQIRNKVLAVNGEKQGFCQSCGNEDVVKY